MGLLALALASTSAPVPREVHAGFAVVVWGVAVIGIALGAFPRAPVGRAAIFAGGLLASFTILSAVSLLWASDPGNGIDQVARASGYTGLFVLVVVAARDGEGVFWLRGLAIGLVAVSVAALAPRLLPDLFGAPDAALDASGRIGYPIHYWNGLAAMMAAAVALLAWLASQAPARAVRALSAAALVLPVVVLYMARSRGGLLATVAAVAVLVAVGPARARVLANLALLGVLIAPLIGFIRLRSGFLEQPGSELAADQGVAVMLFLVATVAAVGVVRFALDRPLGRFEFPRRFLFPLAALATILGILALAAANPGQRLDDFCEPPTNAQTRSDSASGLSERSGGGRCQFWETALDAFADRPLAGAGAGEFGVFWNQNGAFGFQVQNAHSLFLEALAELGLGGFLIVFGFFALAFLAASVRAIYIRDGSGTVALALIAAGAISAAFDFVWELPAVFSGVILATALCTGRGLTPPLINPPPAPASPSRRPARGLALAGVTLAFGWVSLVLCGTLLLAERSLDRSRAAVSAGDYRTAVEEARRAGELLPFSAEPQVQLGLAYMRAGDYVSARRETLVAIERADEDWRWWRQLALIDGLSGNLRAACEDIATARELNPRQRLLYRPTAGLSCRNLPRRPPS